MSCFWLMCLTFVFCCRVGLPVVVIMFIVRVVLFLWCVVLLLWLCSVVVGLDLVFDVCFVVFSR